MALVTGGGSGIGRAAAILFARQGACVVIADVSQDGGEETVAIIKSENKVHTNQLHNTIQQPQPKDSRAVFVKCNVGKEEDVKNLIETAVREFGGVHYCLNNAGVAQRPQRLHRVEEKEFDKVIDVNLKGIYLFDCFCFCFCFCICVFVLFLQFVLLNMSSSSLKVFTCA